MKIPNNNIQSGQGRTLLLALMLLFALLPACVAGTSLKTVQAVPNEADGTFTLYLHGCRYPSDIENIAILVDAASPYRFELFALPAAYKVKTGLAGSEAAAEAQKFIRCSIYDAGQSVMRRIVDPSGRTLAFELKPIYARLEMGAEEVLLSDYVLRDGQVRVYLRLDPNVERMRRHDVPAMGDK
jgi:hypothetical protein